VEDRDAERYLKLFTFLPLERIGAVMAEHATDPARRTAQRELAREITSIVHGAEAAEQAIQTSAALFGGGELSLDALPEMPERRVARADLPDDLPVVEVLVAAARELQNNAAGDQERLLPQRRSTASSCGSGRVAQGWRS
jgi:tyrosyl-tRNA synthetase